MSASPAVEEAAAKGAADKGAIALSTLCLLHCLGLPLLIALLPWMAWVAPWEARIHAALLILVLPLSLWALARGCARHGHWAVAGVGVVALAALLLALLLEDWAPAMALPLTVLGSLALVASHVCNLRLGARCAPLPDGHA